MMPPPLRAPLSEPTCLHYKSLFYWPDVTKSNTLLAFYCVNELCLYDRFAIIMQMNQGLGVTIVAGV